MMDNRFYPEASGAETVWFVIGSPWPLAGAYLALVNLWAFALMGIDKRKAKKKGARRIRERTLFLSALLGGSAGAAAGMWIFRHKTKHWYFVWGMPGILILQLVLAWLLVRRG